jgi:hypothetical protein
VPLLDRHETFIRLVVLAGVFACVFMAFWFCLTGRSWLAETKIVRLAERAAAVALHPLRRRLPPIFAWHRTASGHGEIDSDLALLLLIVIFLLFAALPMALPLSFARWFPRAAAVPFVIGGWIPFFAVLSGLGRRLHAPLILFVLVLNTILSPRYQVDVIEGTATGVGETTPIKLAEAVAWWKTANDCDENGHTHPCPRPVIVAAAGGASRAGFFTASVIGQLLDDQLKLGDDRLGHGLTPPQLTNRLFAFSTVSGSSLAAVLTVAAMAASSDGQPPCRVRPSGYWDPNPDFKHWRSCLESLLSGDFLTPIFIGLAFHDTMRILHLPDRAQLLEEAWRDQFRRVIRQDRGPKDGLACAGSLECPFMTLRPRPEHWLPLLVLNGTSVATGQRIVTTALAMTYQPQPQVLCPTERRSANCDLFVDTYRFHDLLNGPVSDPAKANGSSIEGDGRPAKTRDIDLGMAALNSARFPLVSPPAEIRDNSGEVVDGLVDGGYFENFGVQTATEMAQAVKAVDATLEPFVLVLSNDPDAVQQERDARHERVERGDLPYLTDISAPITAFANTRNARGALAFDEARAQLARNTCNIAEIRVWGEKRHNGEAHEISMSWWLSEPLQKELHAQTEFPIDSGPVWDGSNGDAILVLLGALASEHTENDAKPWCPFDDQ